MKQIARIFRSIRFIIKYIKPIDHQLTAFFKMKYYGQCTAGNIKTKKPTRVSIIIPREISNDNLKFLNNWIFYIIGVKLDNLTI